MRVYLLCIVSSIKLRSIHVGVYWRRGGGGKERTAVANMRLIFLGTQVNVIHMLCCMIYYTHYDVTHM